MEEYLCFRNFVRGVYFFVETIPISVYNLIVIKGCQ